MQISASLPSMRDLDPIARELVEALNEPALLVEEQIVQLANRAARDLLGDVEGGDVRLAIRQPQALDFVLQGDPGEIDFTGAGALVMPIVSIDGQPVANGHPGEVARTLRAAYIRRAEETAL